MKGKLFILLTALLLSGCTGRYAAMPNTMASCGYPQVKYPKFQECMQTKITVSTKPRENDFYRDSSKELLAKLSTIRKTYDKKKNDKRAYNELAQYIDMKITEEREQSKKAAIAIAVIAGGVAIAACANNGGCGGGGYGDGGPFGRRYPGNCYYPDDIAADGTRCGNRAATVRPGGW